MLFAYDRNMTWLAHPARPELVGQNWIDKKIGLEASISAGRSSKSRYPKAVGGWNSNMKTLSMGNMIIKPPYVDGIDDLIICSGAYKGDGEILAVLGMDIDASDWNWTIARAAWPSILFTVALTAILFVGMVLLSRRSSLKCKPSFLMRRLELCLVVTVGLVLTLFCRLDCS